MGVCVRVYEYAGSLLRLPAHNENPKKHDWREKSEKCIAYMNICSPILALKRLVAGVPGGVGDASHSSSISVPCEERGEAEGGEEIGRTAKHLVVSLSPTY